MSENSDLLVVLEVNKMMYPMWCFLMLLCKLDIAKARLLNEKDIVSYIHKIYGSRIRDKLHGS